MRLLLVNRALPVHTAGGLERHVEDLAVGLSAKGHEIHLLVAELPPLQAASERSRLAGLGIILHEFLDIPAGRYSLAWMRGIGSQINNLYRRINFDVIHAQEFAAGFWLPDSQSPPFVMTVHGTITTETPLHRDVWPLVPLREKPAALLRYGRRFFFTRPWRAGLHAADRVLADSQFTRTELTRAFPEISARLRVIPLGVPWAADSMPDHESARLRLGWAGPTLQLLTIGRLEWAKGQDLAISALAKLKQLPWHYTLAGEGSWQGRLKHKISKAGLADRIFMLGRVDLSRKQLLLAAADLFIWPERTHPAFGLVGMEAHLAGTPVIAARRGAIPEILGEDPKGSRWMADQPTVNSFRERLAELLNEPESLRVARSNLRASALRRFSFEQMLHDLLQVYQEIQHQPGR